MNPSNPSRLSGDVGPISGAPLSPIAVPTEESFRALVQAIEDYAVFMLDATGRIISWNAGAAKLKGYAEHEILGSHFSRFYTAEAVERGWPAYELEQARLLGRFADEGWRVRKDGTLFWANVIITARRGSGGAVVGFAKVTRDLTTQREADEALRRSEERFRLLVEGVSDYAIFMLDPDGRVMSWNAGAAHINGYRRDEIVGQHFSVFYAAEDVATGKPLRELTLAREQGRAEDEGWRVRKDGTTFWANVTITAIYDEARELRGFAKVTRDMSERKRLEEVEQASQRMKKFLAMLAHELRNPLAPVRNALAAMQLEEGVSETVRRCRDTMDRQITHLTRLVEDLLDVGRITSGKVELRIAPVELRDVLVRSVEAAQPFIDARQQSIDLQMERTSIVVSGDMTRLVQVVQNLLHNASKFSPEGSCIGIHMAIENRMAVLRVSDAGCGIPQDALDTIFSLFTQVPVAQNTGESGLGIGLTLCRSLIELHHGSIFAASAGLGKGSVFTVRLPAHPELAPLSMDDKTSEPRYGTPGLRVLIVDDNRDSADSLAMLFEMKGHRAQVVYRGEHAVEAARRLTPNIALIDLAMPGIDGFTVLRMLRALPELRGTRFAAMTGFGQSSDRERTREAGFDVHLVKPVDMTLLDEFIALAATPREAG
ncbi:PAS domain-containing hybrid sensor histidine kinase/response regulator [Paraburkholderia megapolitana]|uniref:histidine kinase n=1 Tax=Paraburkholderia megapolitana TaxID=420953 RepID=A0A1I3RLV2_9BURK|nr:PAS domain S-box protein [Paraburkholderia megapolitana]QDQ83961.1 PAS domain S-box protein [Paraburkholderia megapolitana]SFJ47594.1 PAS/PAC sensor hybrid histidine kinase [Paraburkholderia megapolitana]